MLVFIVQPLCHQPIDFMFFLLVLLFYSCACIDLESQLRKLRQSSANLEEENALLSQHVESMKRAVERLQDEVQKQEERNNIKQNHLNALREVLTVAFKDVAIPDSNETPTIDNIGGYIGKLQIAIAMEPEKHPALLEKVGMIAKQLEKVLKEKLTQSMEEPIVDKIDSEQEEISEKGSAAED